MNAEQITNIAIKIGEAQQKADFALWCALIAAASAIVAAFVAGYFKLQLNRAQKEHDKQWAFIAKRSDIIDRAIEVGLRMMFNKLLLAQYNYAEAPTNLFLLNKDGLAIESQMVVYGSLEVAAAFAEFRETIMACPPEKVLERWDEMYKKGQDVLYLCRQNLGIDVTESFKDFKKKLQTPPPKQEVPPIVSTTTMGTISIQKHDEIQKQ